MTARAGTKEGDKLWQRCPFCGDSQSHPSKAHFFISLSSLSYHCYRCGENGILPVDAIVELLADGRFVDFLDSREYAAQREASQNRLDLVMSSVIRGPGTDRRSWLQRYHYIRDGKVYDAFEQRDPSGRILGYNLRRGKGETKEAYSVGRRGIGYHGDNLTRRTRPIYVVEGPYDVINSDCVCCFGLFSIVALNHLRGRPVVLVPDGDVWDRPELLATIDQNIKKAHASVFSVVKLPKHLDPGDLDDFIDQESLSYGEFYNRYIGNPNRKVAIRPWRTARQEQDHRDRGGTSRFWEEHVDPQHNEEDQAW